ncbi:MAG TPA: MMPL family transporter [Usitatibacter sp.]|nr:MMPL family transporter [Usitatibacter sp.]
MRRALPVVLWAALLALCALQVARTRFVADLSSFLPAAPSAEQRLLVEQLREGALSRVMLMAIEGGDGETRARLSRALTQRLAADPRFASVSDGAAAGFAREKDFLFEHRYALSPGVAPQRFTEAGLRSAISDTISLLASPAGALVKPLVLRDPTGETLALLEGLRPAGGPRMAQGVWVSPDGRRALLLARTRASGSDIDAQAQAMQAAESAFDALRAAPGGEARGARLEMTGPGVFSVRSRALVKHDVERFSVLGIAIVASLLLAVYRSPLALALGLVPVLTGALVGVAAVSLGFGLVHGITLGFGTTLIGEAVDYSIYLFVQAGQGERAGDAAWLAGFWPTIRLGVLTSIAGFSALLFSGLPGLAQLGLYSIAGLAAAALVTRFVLPRLLPARFRMRDLSALGGALRSLAVRATRLRLAVAALALAALAVLAAHRSSVWDPELSTLNPIPAADRELDAQLRAALGASDARYMVAVRGAGLEEALAAAERAGAALDPLVAGGRLAGYESPARFLPSLATQRARLASLPDPAILRTRLRAALDGLPLRPERLEPFVEDVARARDSKPLTPESLAGTALGAALDGMLLRDGEGWTAILALRPPAGSHGLDARAVREAIASARVPGAAFVDLKGELDRLYAGYLQRALAMSAVGLVAIVALLFAALRSPARVVRVMAPLAAGVAVVAAAHVLAGTRLSILHLVGLLLVVAVGSNYALFFDRMAVQPEETAPRTLASLALANATTVASFGLLALSSIPVLHAIGSTVAAGAIATLVFAAALAPRAHGVRR